jgi:hypothetical protein
MYVKSGMIKSQLDVKKPAPSCTLKSEYGALVDALEMFHLELRSSHADSLTSASAHNTTLRVTSLSSPQLDHSTCSVAAQHDKLRLVEMP